MVIHEVEESFYKLKYIDEKNKLSKLTLSELEVGVSLGRIRI